MQPHDPAASWEGYEGYHELEQPRPTNWEELLDTVVPTEPPQRSARLQELEARATTRRLDVLNDSIMHESSLAARRSNLRALPPHFSNLSPFSPPISSNQQSSYFPEHEQYEEQYNPQHHQRPDEYHSRVSNGGQYGPPDACSPRLGNNNNSFAGAYPTPYSNPSPLLHPAHAGSSNTPPSPFLPQQPSTYAIDSAHPNDRVREWLGPAGGMFETRESGYAEMRQDGWAGRDEIGRNGVEEAEQWRRYTGLPAHAEFAARIPTFPFVPLQGPIPSQAQRNFGPISPHSPDPLPHPHQRTDSDGSYHLNPQWTTPPPLAPPPLAPPPPYDHLYPYDASMMHERFNPQTSFFDSQNASSSSHGHQQSPDEDSRSDFVASNRSLVASTSKRGRKTVTRREPCESISSDEEPVSKRKQKKVTVELECQCVSCGIRLARLILRGQTHELNVPHSASYTCLLCTQQLSTLSPVESRSSEGPSEQPLSASSGQPSAPPTKPSSRKTSTSFRKRTTKGDDSAPTKCDVCLRDVMMGDVVVNETRSKVGFAVEVVCVQCSEKYKRCTDCGGGGGVRLGVGKWRSKELFADGRKTCTLSHLRLGALSDMFYDVWPVSLLPEDELDELTSRCKVIFQNTLLSGMCTPEVLETQSAIAQSFTEAKSFSEQGWKLVEPMMRVDIEDAKSIRRYVALRFCSPNPRKNSRAKAAAEAAKPQDETKCLRSNKDLVGFILAEYDLLLGSIFITVVVPWATGETYDATSLLFQALLVRAAADRAVLNVERARRGLPAYPPIIQVWTMMFFKRDTRMMNHLTKKRGFSTLEDYMKLHPDANLAAFPPIRPVYIPEEYQTGWQVMVRRQSDEGADDWNPRKGAEDGRQKSKEQRAQAKRRGAD